MGGKNTQHRIRKNSIKISKLKALRWFGLGFAFAIGLLSATNSVATQFNKNVSFPKSNNLQLNSSDTLRDSVAYNLLWIPSPKEDQQSNKLIVASIATDGIIRIPETTNQVQDSNINCNCVKALNQKFGTNFKTLDGFARSIPINSKVPAEIGFVITYESFPGTNTGHIAHYYKDYDEIVLDWEANYERCQFSSGRRLPINSPLIKGYNN
jgi:hypothetical protein